MTRLSLAIFLTILTSAFVTGAVADEDSAVVRLSEPVESTEAYETFGSPLDETRTTVSLSALAEDSESYIGEPVLITARVSEVCQKKGCFFVAQEGQAVIRVSFVDYSFFVPTDISGRRVTMAGELVRREITAEQADHLNSDLGGEGTVEAGVVYEIVATSVRVPRG